MLLFLLFNLSAFFSGSESAFFSIDELSLKKLRKQEHVLASLMLRLLEKREKLLTTILLGNEVVNVAISSVSAALFMDAFGEKWVGASVFVTTFFLLVYGELLPKVIAVRYNTLWAGLAAPFLILFSYLLFPLRVVLEWISLIISRLVGKEDVSIKEEDFKVLVEEARSRGQLEELEKRMIYSVFEFTELRVKDVMVPEPDVFMVDIDTPIEELKSVVESKKFSKIPVYEGERDNVLGYVKITDLLPVFRGLDSRPLRELKRDCPFVPETLSLQELLNRFQSEKFEIAMVVDEHGAVQGLVVLEDILEELVGEIWDEYDVVKPLVLKVKEGVYEVEARCPLAELKEVLGLSFPEDLGVDTVGGLVMHLLGRVPKQGERAYYKGWSFTVIEATKRRVLRVKVERVEDEVFRDEG